MIKDFNCGFMDSVGAYGLGFMAGQMLTFLICVCLPIFCVVWFIAYNRSQDKTPRVG